MLVEGFSRASWRRVVTHYLFSCPPVPHPKPLSVLVGHLGLISTFALPSEPIFPSHSPRPGVGNWK